MREEIGESRGRRGRGTLPLLLRRLDTVAEGCKQGSLPATTAKQGTPTAAALLPQSLVCTALSLLECHVSGKLQRPAMHVRTLMLQSTAVRPTAWR